MIYDVEPISDTIDDTIDTDVDKHVEAPPSLAATSNQEYRQPTLISSDFSVFDASDASASVFDASDTDKTVDTQTLFFPDMPIASGDTQISAQKPMDVQIFHKEAVAKTPLSISDAETKAHKTGAYRELSTSHEAAEPVSQEQLAKEKNRADAKATSSDQIANKATLDAAAKTALAEQVEEKAVSLEAMAANKCSEARAYQNTAEEFEQREIPFILKSREWQSIDQIKVPSAATKIVKPIVEPDITKFNLIEPPVYEAGVPILPPLITRLIQLVKNNQIISSAVLLGATKAVKSVVEVSDHFIAVGKIQSSIDVKTVEAYHKLQSSYEWLTPEDVAWDKLTEETRSIIIKSLKVDRLEALQKQLYSDMEELEQHLDSSSGSISKNIELLIEELAAKQIQQSILTDLLVEARYDLMMASTKFGYQDFQQMMSSDPMMPPAELLTDTGLLTYLNVFDSKARIAHQEAQSASDAAQTAKTEAKAARDAAQTAETKAKAARDAAAAEAKAKADRDAAAAEAKAARDAAAAEAKAARDAAAAEAKAKADRDAAQTAETKAKAARRDAADKAARKEKAMDRNMRERRREGREERERLKNESGKGKGFRSYPKITIPREPDPPEIREPNRQEAGSDPNLQS